MKGRIDIVAASAGSGKTTRLARELEEAVTLRGIAPDRIVATTFTKKAAAELIERGRQALLRVGRAEEAELFRAARIGTVNAVAGALVSDFAFEAGVSPDLIVLDETRAEEAFRRSLGEVVTRDDLAELGRLGGRFHELSWQSIVQEIVGAARTNHIAEEALGACCDESVRGMTALFDPVSEAAEHLDAALEGALLRGATALRAKIDSGADRTQKTAQALDEIERASHRMRAQRSLAWPQWASLAGVAAAVKTDPLCEEVRNAASAFLRHPQLHADCENAIRLCFRLAGRALAAYRRFKRERRAIDFIDQETIAFELLGRPEVKDVLASEIELVLVDEMQDTSPLQLALFLSLARIAPRSLWVGDQKQAIFGFRGADPALMDAVVGELLGGEEPETLAEGRRSRAALVHLTNALFVPPFHAAGLPASRVLLSPASPGEASALGPAVERWRLAARNKDDEATALAAHVRGLLDDESVLVRDRADGSIRRLAARDVAVLCRRRDACLAVAGRLAEVGVGCEVARGGLLGTLEGRAVVAGLRLWVDGHDALARAEVTRLVAPEAATARALLAGETARTGEPDDAAASERGEGERRGGGEGERGGGEIEGVRRLLAAREAAPLVGALEAFDGVVRALAVDELIARGGRGRQGAANLDALRAHVVSFVRLARHRGGAASPAALVAHLEALAADGADAQAQAAGDDAVTVTTWHASKGLEWPVVVLYELDGTFTRSALGVHVEDTREGPLRLDAPLEGRTIRFWPSPFHPRAGRTAFHERLRRHETAIRAAERAQHEEVRLLYVGWTRARDRLVLAGRGELASGSLALFALGGGQPLTEPRVPADATTGTGTTAATGPAVTPVQVRWGGVDLTVGVRRAPAIGAVSPHGATSAEILVPLAHRTYPQGRLRPSEMDQPGSVLAVERIGDPCPVDLGALDPTSFGIAVHAFFAADVPGLDDDDRAELGARLLEAWGVSGAIETGALHLVSTRFQAWAAARWPGARVRRELPIEHQRPGGTLVRGIIDVAIELEDEADRGRGAIVVDHKVLVCDEARALEEAAGYTGQLRVYADALAAAGARGDVETWIHLPLSGLVVRVG